MSAKKYPTECVRLALTLEATARLYSFPPQRLGDFDDFDAKGAVCEAFSALDVLRAAAEELLQLRAERDTIRRIAGRAALNATEARAEILSLLIRGDS